MIIENGPSKKHLNIFPPTKLSIDPEDPFRIIEDDELVFPILTIDRDLCLKKNGEDNVYSNFSQNLYEIPFLLEDVVIEQDWELTRVLVKNLSGKDCVL